MRKVSLSNKVFTENPLLDEIVYNARQLATGVVIKDEDKANNAETTESIHNGDVLVAINKGTVHFSNFKYDADFLEQYYQDRQLAEKYAKDNSLIPESDRPALLKMAVEQFSENYIEYNSYYRMLNGKPRLDREDKFESDKVWKGIWILNSAIDDSSATPVDDENFKVTTPWIYDPVEMKYIVDPNYTLIHELDMSDKNLLYSNGTCEAITKDSSWLASWELVLDDVSYLLHIGDREVDYYDARITEKFGLLYCPKCDSEEVKRRFKDLFEANRLYMLYTVYSDAYKYRSDYYDNFMMIFLIIQTIIDMIVELPEYIIRRDVFDTRTCKYIFEANGVKYFKDIPLKYQIALVKNLNKLIKFKSTDKCIVDIISIFGVENIEVFRYYILKDRYVGDKDKLDYYDNHKSYIDSMGDTYVVEDNDANYDLKFIKVPLLGNYDDCIRTEKNVYSYDTLVDTDAYWIGDKDYDTIKKDIKDLDFTVLRSKYYSIEAVIDLAKRNFTLTYFMNILMYNKIDKSLLKVNLPNVSTTKKFELVDAILTLFSLSYIYYGVEDTILDSRAKAAQIMGFDMEADLAKISAWLDENHKGLTLKNLHVDSFTVPDNETIMTFDQLQDIFLKNKDCYDVIREVMNDPPSKEIYNAYRYLEKAMLTMNRNMEYFLIGESTIPEEYEDYKKKFIDIPAQTKYYCPSCHALIDFEKLVNGALEFCPVCGKHIGTPVIEEYHNPEDFARDYKWMLASMDYETLYYTISENFDTDHKFKVYVKNDENSLKYIGEDRMAYTYREFLRYKDSTLYSFIAEILSISNMEARQEACVNAIQSIVSYLKDYIDQDGKDAIPLDTVFAGLPSISLDFIKRYVEEVIDFFKSFKIFTHGSSIIYVIQDKFDNYVHLIDHILLKYLLDKSEIVKIEDIIEGKVEKISGHYLNVGPGLGVKMNPKEKHELIDKVWFSISTWLKKNYNDYYNSDNYTEADVRIRDYCERFNAYVKSDKVFTERYIEEIQDYAVDAILKLLVKMVKDDVVHLEETISYQHTKSINDYYNEWMADIAILTAKFYCKDTMPYQDDYLRTDKYDMYTVYPMIDGRKSESSSFGFSDRLGIIDSYYAIITQEL